jgi:hypothetical protein
MHRDPKRGVPFTGVGYDIPRFRVCEVGRSKEAKASTLDGLGAAAILVILFLGLMFL